MVHVLIPVFNRLASTRQIVEALRAQRGVELRVLIIDDGSTDGTAEFLGRQADIEVLSGDGSWWWARAIDAALRRVLPACADDDHVLLLNNDAGIGSDYVATLLHASRAEGGAAVGSVLRAQQPPHALVSIGPRLSARRTRVWDALEELSEQERQQPASIYQVDALSGRGTLYPVPVLRRAGYLRPRLLPHYFADYELAVRARRHGCRLVVSSAAVVRVDADFGVYRPIPSMLRRYFGKGSPYNLLHAVAFWTLVAESRYERITAAPRLLVGMLAARRRRP